MSSPMNSLLPRMAYAPLLAFAPISAAQAQDLNLEGAQPSREVRVYADAPAACVVSTARTQGASNAVFVSDGSAGGTIAITQLVDAETAEPVPANVEIALPVVCNTAHSVVVTTQSGGMLRSGGSPANTLSPDGFADFLPYAMRMDWGGQTRSGQSQAGETFSLQDGPQRGDLLLQVTTPQGGGALTAGTYTDTITIRLEPAS